MRLSRRFVCLLTFTAIFPLALGAQSVPTPPGAGAPPPADLQTASSLFAASDWKAAHAAYAAMAELQRAQRGGLPMTSAQLDRNAHLASLKAHARWTDVVAAFTLASQPCKADPRYRQFDFWIGDWDVRTTGLPPTGPAARNNITLEEGSCIVQEHWTALGGGTGQSYNLFDRSMGKWRQTWVDSNGGQMELAPVGGRQPSRAALPRPAQTELRSHATVARRHARAGTPMRARTPPGQPSRACPSRQRAPMGAARACVHRAAP